MRTARVSTGVHARSLMCLSCGYDGPEVQHDGTWVCPMCGQDLYERPPMSYAEMEGLAPASAWGRSTMPRMARLGRQWGLFRQWVRLWMGVVRAGNGTSALRNVRQRGECRQRSW